MSESTGRGTGRRSFIKTGVGIAAMTAVGLPVAQAGPAAAASGAQGTAGSAGGVADALVHAADWRRYLNGPTSRNVSPVAVTDVVGSVTNAQAVLGKGKGTG